MLSATGIIMLYCLQMAFKADPDERNERVCVAEWNNCAYTISSLGTHTHTHTLARRCPLWYLGIVLQK